MKPQCSPLALRAGFEITKAISKGFELPLDKMPDGLPEAIGALVDFHTGLPALVEFYSTHSRQSSE